LARDGVAGPTTADLLSRAVRPQAATTSGDVIEVDKGRQVMFVVVGGQTQWVLNVSTGSERPYVEKSGLDGHIVTGDAKTPVGRFKVYFERNAGWWESDLGKLWRPKYFVAGFAVHGSDSIPGYPASHGCVRVSVPGMNFIWDANLMPQGRAVWIY
jgi:lipoprotein-anchoring transpeptidase ErfK/SrfK